MASETDTIPKFLDAAGEPNIPWRIWKSMFQNYIVARGGANYAASRRIAILLHCLGTEGQRIYYSLPDPDDPNDYDSVLGILNDHFEEEVNEVAARYNFRKRAQGEAEPFKIWLGDLRYLIKFCNYGEAYDTSLRDQIVEKTNDSRLREKLLRIKRLTLHDAIEMAKSSEAASKDAQEMAASTNGHDQGATVGAIRKTPPKVQSEKRSCYRCGKVGRVANSPECPAKSATCSKCGRVGHFQRVCRNGTKFGPGEEGHVRHLESGNQVPPNAQAGTESGTLGVDHVQICQIGAYKSCAQPIYHSINFRGKTGKIDQSMMVDTGSPKSIISESFYLRQLSHIPLQQDSVRLVDYGKNEIPIKGKIKCQVYGRKRAYQCEFYVVSNGMPLLGRDVIQTLGMQISGTTLSVNTTDDDRAAKYPMVFKEDLGPIKGFQHKIQIQPDAVPVAKKVRPIPYAIRDQVKAELDNLEKQGVIEKIDASEWVHQLTVAAKKDGTLRICCDLRELNNVVIGDRFPLPNINELFHSFTGCNVFTELDLKKAYFQMELAPESRNLTAFNTPWGLFQYKRLPMGLKSSSSAFQKMMSSLLSGFEYVAVFQDNVIIGGKSDDDLEQRTDAVLQKFNQHNITINKSKSKFGEKQLRTLGHTISAEGVTVDEGKLDALLKLPAPSDFPMLRSYLGMCTYYLRFVPKFSSITAPLREILKNEIFSWSSDAESAFQKLKIMLCQAPVLAYFVPGAKTFVSVDASGQGIGAFLTQIQNGKEVLIECASRALNDYEKKYSVPELEALAAVFACEKWHIYLWGNPFVLRTDHQSLVTLLGSSGYGRKPFRIARWYLRLMVYSFTVEYHPGALNFGPDLLSRNPILTTSDVISDAEECEEYNIAVITGDLPISSEELQRATDDDTVLTQIRGHLRNNWPNQGALSKELRVFYPMRHSISEKDGILLTDENKVILPYSLQARAVKEAHVGHLGIPKTLGRLQQHFWWPGMSTEAKAVVNGCCQCSMSDKGAKPINPPMQVVENPMVPWSKVGIDILGPFQIAPSNQKYLIVLTDYYTKWPEVGITGAVTANAVINFLEPLFNRFGFPTHLISDNGPQFRSIEFEDFLKSCGVKHDFTAVANPRANGQAERFNGFLKAIITGPHTEPFAKVVADALVGYRSSPHATTGKSPYELLFGRKMRTKLSACIPDDIKKSKVLESVENRIKNSQAKYKQQHDSRNSTSLKEFHVGDKVRYKLQHVPKGKSTFSEPYTIVRKMGPYTYKISNGQVWNMRNMIQFRGSNA